jgi:hypothetical protein
MDESQKKLFELNHKIRKRCDLNLVRTVSSASKKGRKVLKWFSALFSQLQMNCQ